MKIVNNANPGFRILRREELAKINGGSAVNCDSCYAQYQTCLTTNPPSFCRFILNHCPACPPPDL